MNKYQRHIKKSPAKKHLKSKMATIGGTFKQARMTEKKSILQVSNETKISTEKLKGIERNDFTMFDSAAHTSGFIKIYADYLGLDRNRMLAIYRRSTKNYANREGKKKGWKETGHGDKKFSNTSKFLIIPIPLLVILFVLSYLYIQYYNYQNPPLLEIATPTQNEIVKDELINITGKTEGNTIVTINNAAVAINDDLSFNKEITLQPGTNILTIRAQNTRNPSRENTVILTIEYFTETKGEEEGKEEGEDTENEQKESDNNITIKVENAATWIEVILDNQIIMSQVVQSGYERSIEVEKSVSISTGVALNTIIEKNDEIVTFPPDSLTIVCEINDEEELKCE